MRASGKPGCRVAIIAGALCFAAHSANAQNSNSVLFGSIQPSANIWVSAGANGDGDGSRDRPFKRIQDAVSSARAGTAIMVKAGEYHENVKLPSVSPGALTAPIWLMSADGPEAAKIIAASEKLAAIYGYGTDNFIVKDFLIEGGKNGIQFSQSGRTFTNMVENILVEGNTVLNAVEDGIKIDQAKNVQILGNIVRTTGQEDIDFVAVNNSIIAYNDVSGASGAAGIMVKGGSTSVAVLANRVHDIPVADGIMVGGSTGEQFFVPGFTGYEAKDVTISDNEVRHVAKRPLNFLGAIDSRATHNFFEGNVNYYTAVNVSEGSPRARAVAHSANLEISGNIIANKLKLAVSPGSNSNIAFHDNSLNGNWNTQTGPAAFRNNGKQNNSKAEFGREPH